LYDGPVNRIRAAAVVTALVVVPIITFAAARSSTATPATPAVVLSSPGATTAPSAAVAQLLAEAEQRSPGYTCSVTGPTSGECTKPGSAPIHLLF
jgi:hypothetical protein